MALGVAILAAICPKNESGSVPNGEKSSKFSIKSGTSMACPHVTGADSFIKSVHRGWIWFMIKISTYDNRWYPKLASIIWMVLELFNLTINGTSL
ncbi:PREDICTED: xylem serine proteinase 1-like [Fragaria vesca subsp. vesca]